MRNIGEEFDYRFENGIMRYVVVAHVLAAPDEFVDPVLMEEVRAIKWTPSITQSAPDLGQAVAKNDNVDVAPSG